MFSEIISALIGMLGSILSAIIGLNLFEKIINRRTTSVFTTFSNKQHDASRQMNRAKESITIVSIYGNNFLKKHKDNLDSYLKSGIKVEYLLLDYQHALELDHIYCGISNSATNHELREVLRILKDLSKYPNLQVRVLSTCIPASYIGIDIYEKWALEWSSAAFILMMPYQYGVDSPNTPIVYLDPKKNKDHFYTISCSIQNMWKAGKAFDFDAYEKELTQDSSCCCKCRVNCCKSIT